MGFGPEQAWFRSMALAGQKGSRLGLAIAGLCSGLDRSKENKIKLKIK